jgi:hypothetical protein
LNIGISRVGGNNHLIGVVAVFASRPVTVGRGAELLFLRPFV